MESIKLKTIALLKRRRRIMWVFILLLPVAIILAVILIMLNIPESYLMLLIAIHMLIGAIDYWALVTFSLCPKCRAPNSGKIQCEHCEYNLNEYSKT